jgi:Ser/Thr protein kinase RdoA (MazF antagonist)
MSVPDFDEEPDDDIGNRMPGAPPERPAMADPRAPAQLEAQVQSTHVQPPLQPDQQSHLQPFSQLTPDCLLDALEAVGLPVDGRLMALNSYENRVYQVGLDDGSSRVAKVYRPGRWSDAAILEEHAFALELAEAELQVVAPLRIEGATLHHHAGFRFAVFPRQGGWAPEFDNLDTLRRMGHLLGRLHAVGRRGAFAERGSIDIDSFGRRPIATLQRLKMVSPELAEAYFSTAEAALAEVAACYERAGPVRRLRLHGDCHVGNVLWTDGPHLVDLDDARTGPSVQDIWMLFSGTPEHQRRQRDAFLEAYAAFVEFDAAEWHLVEALRTLRLIHHAAWIAERWDDPAFPAAFSWFATPRYWQDRILELKEQLAAMSDAPALL